MGHATKDILDDRDELDESLLSGEVDIEKEVSGSTYIVPDKFWGISVVGRKDHPGTCISCSEREQSAVLLKGSDALLRRSPAFVIEPSRGNGLTKATAFELAPRHFRLRRLLLLHANRRLGRLDTDDLARLRNALARRFPSRS